MTQTIEATGAGGEGEQDPLAPPTPEEQRSAFLRLVILLGAAAFLTVATGTTKHVLIVVAVLTMIMLHELGHFVTAKWSHMKVTEFFVGFGPRLWSVRKGETEYGIKALPVGGYVKIIGMHNLDQIADPADEPRTYRRQPFRNRLAVAVAGSTMHFLIAFVLFFVVNTFVGIPGVSTTIGGLVTLEGGPSPAQAAGLRVGDTIKTVDGKAVHSFAELRDLVAGRPGQPLAMTVERNDTSIELTATPTDLSTVRIKGEPISDEARGFLGLEPAPLKVDPITALGRSAKQWVGGDFQGAEDVSPGLIDNAKALGGIFSPSGVSSYLKTVAGEDQADRPDGGARFLSPVGLVRLGGQAADDGMFWVLGILIAINLFVGIFNLLPLLPLDGGHVAIAVYEAVRSKLSGRRYTADVAKLLPLTYAVVLLVVFLGVTSLYLDIVRPLNFQ
jgi:membrane-associated protease RseP (regulator of RpoE activity)